METAQKILKLEKGLKAIRNRGLEPHLFLADQEASIRRAWGRELGGNINLCAKDVLKALGDEFRQHMERHIKQQIEFLRAQAVSELADCIAQVQGAGK